MSKTLEQIQDELDYCGNRDTIHLRFEGPFELIDLDAQFVREAWEQVKRAIYLIETGIDEPKYYRAEALLLTLFGSFSYHGYNRKPKEDESHSHRASDR